MSKIEILTRAYQTWNVFEGWSLANGKVFTEYEDTMFRWMALYGACVPLDGDIDVVSDEVLAFVDNLLNGASNVL